MAPQRKPSRKQTRGNSRSRPRETAPPVEINVTRQREPENDNDDDDRDTTPARDRALVLFLRRPPMAADHFVTTVHTHHGESILQDRSVAEVRDEPVELANATIEASERWARADGREVRFRATWQAGDRVLASHQWTSGEGDPTALDGTVDSFLAQQQRHQEADHRLHHDGFAMVQDGWKSLLKLAQTQIETLSKENAELRERLRKSGDVDNEIAMAHAASELEGRARTAELIESRILPLVQHMAMKYLETGATNLNGGSPASTADPAPAA